MANIWEKAITILSGNLNSGFSYLITTVTFFSVWYDSPTVTVVDSMTYPIEELAFPSVTLCPENSNPDRWGTTIKIFDHFEKKCPATG